MLSVQEVENFAELIRTGALEDKFKFSSEAGRGEILELLEKLMDLGELADECATRLIYRGALGAAAARGAEKPEA